VSSPGPAAAEFLKCYRGLVERFVRANPGRDPNQAEDRERVLRWLDSHQALAERLECGECFLGVFRSLLAAVREKLLAPWDRELGRRRYVFFRRKVAPVSLGHADRVAIPDDAAATALEKLTAAVREGGAAARERKADFEGALAQWHVWCSGRGWVEGVARLEGDARQQREDVEAALSAWEQGWCEAARRLRKFLERLGVVLEHFGQLTPEGERATARLARAQRESLRVEAAEDSLAWIQGNWPAPAERVEATFPLWELDGVIS
jgi:hypothetical protein